MKEHATAGQSVRRFIDHHPHGHLFVLVAYASVWGLSWLQQHTQGRKVTLLIGDTRRKAFQKATESDRGQALQFLRRSDVEVLNWYRTNRSKQGAAQLHAKAWFVTDQNNELVGALDGSADLTKQGMTKNVEIMTSVPRSDLPSLWLRVDAFLKGESGERAPWTRKEHLVEILGAGTPSPPPQRVRPKPKTAGRSVLPPPQRAPPKLKPEGVGCLTWIFGVATIVAVLLYYL